jgi:hypothetical protein
MFKLFILYGGSFGMAPEAAPGLRLPYVTKQLLFMLGVAENALK